MKKRVYYLADLHSDFNRGLDKELVVTPLISKRLGTFTYIYNIGKQFYFSTNYKASKGRIIKIDAENPD